MNFSDWEPHYQKILDYFGFDRSGDEEAAILAHSLIERDSIDYLREAIKDKVVTVCGNAPSLMADVNAGKITGVIYAADAAADRLYRRGIRPDIISTDLDGCEDSFLAMNKEGTILVVHAHGDNMALLKNWIPKFCGKVVLTTQSRPIDRVYNFGGFTDGDRAVFTAKDLGAKSINLIGFDLDDSEVPPMKHGKLMIARELLDLIGYRI